MMRPIDQKKMTIDSLLLTVSKRRGHTTPHRGRAAWKSTRDPQEAEGERVKHGQEPLLYFLWGRQGKAR